MKVNIATKVFNEEWYLDFFIRYYLDLGIDEIHFFDSASHDRTLEIIHEWSKKEQSVKLIITDEELRLSNDRMEILVCNQVLQHAKNRVQQTQEDMWWIFADIDEFLRPPEEGVKAFFKNMSHSVVRSVFFEWYLPPEMYEAGTSVKKILQMARKGELKGRLLDVLGDPFYKDFVFFFTPDNINGWYSTLRTILGNHRYFVNEELLIPPNEPFLIFDHVRGTSKAITMRRIDLNLKLQQEDQIQKRQDHSTALHFRQIKDELIDYETFYKNLHSFQELEAKKRQIPAYDSNTSDFNKIAYYYILTQELDHVLTEPHNQAH